MDKCGIMPIKLPVFQANELKHFRFSIEQYCQLEIEYNRYMIYKDIIKSIENQFKFAGINNDIMNRRMYESKSIIDRFVLECINHGIAPHLGNTLATADTTDNTDLAILANQLFFNPVLSDEGKLKDTIFFRKMIAEYIEKRFKFVIEKVPAILKIFAHANHKFMKYISELNQMKNKLGAFTDIQCCILASSQGENYIIRYRSYSKVINFNRYIKLIKNYN